jgi:Flp pilus assembly protein TadD
VDRSEGRADGPSSAAAVNDGALTLPLKRWLLLNVAVGLWLLGAVGISRLAHAEVAQERSQISVQVEKLLVSNKIAEADQLVQQHLRQQAPSAAGLFELGRVYFEHDHWKQASELLRRSLDLENQNDVAHLLLGLSLAELKQFDESERELQTAVHQNPQSDLNWYFAGWRLLLRGKYEASLPYFYKAVELNPKNPNAHRALGSALARTGSYGLAEDYYRKAIEIVERAREATPEPYLDLAYLLLFSNQKESAAQALDYARKAIAIDSRIASAHYLCGKALLKLEQDQEAQNELLIAAKLDPQDGRPFFLLAQIYDRLGNTAKAREARDSFAKLTQRRADESQGMSDSRP